VQKALSLFEKGPLSAEVRSWDLTELCVTALKACKRR
jgi:hypothetical protein